MSLVINTTQGHSAAMKMFTFEHPIELGGALKMKADDTPWDVEANRKAILPPMFDLMASIVDIDEIHSVIANKDNGTICFHIYLKLNEVWSIATENLVKDNISSALEGHTALNGP